MENISELQLVVPVGVRETVGRDSPKTASFSRAAHVLVFSQAPSVRKSSGLCL